MAVQLDAILAGRELFPHHETFVRQVADRFSRDPAALAPIVGGSVAHGLARPDSDLDVMLVLPDDELGRWSASGEVRFADLDAP